MSALKESFDEVIVDIWKERLRAAAIHDNSQLPDGTGGSDRTWTCELTRDACGAAFQRGEGTWLLLLAEEIAEAFAETNEDKLYEELSQAGQLITAWMQSLKLRKSCR